jgi:membrane fusion protein, copper/silver efflux system
MPTSSNPDDRTALNGESGMGLAVEPRAHSSVVSIGLAAVFFGAVIFGLLFERDLTNAWMRSLPDPNAGRHILYWQSPMDPSIRSKTPGKTPMGMKLTPVYADEEPTKGPVTVPPEIQESEHTTILVEKGPLVRSLETVSTVSFAEPMIGDVALKMEGWLEKLYVDYKGQTVKKGDPLFDVYAPDLFAAEEEFLISLQYAKNGAASQAKIAAENLESARVKLRFLDMTDEQIDRLADKGIVQKTLTYYSPFSGIVIEKNTFEGKAVPAGQTLYRIADLSKIWVNLFIYENQIQCVAEGQGATLTLSGLPDRVFQGKIVFVYPYLEPKSRTVKVRLEFDNPDLLLMPDMFGRVKLEPHRMGEGLRLPRSAVMQTGKRNLVYVALPGNRFEAREVRTGMELDGNELEVLSGLKAGERVVAAPEFLMDSESRIRLIDRKFRPLSTPERDASRSHSMSNMKKESMNSNSDETKPNAHSAASTDSPQGE